jgi:hypothetical protein
MSGAIPPLPQYAFMAWWSVEAQGQLYLYLLLNELSNNGIFLFNATNKMALGYTQSPNFGINRGWNVKLYHFGYRAIDQLHGADTFLKS